VPPLADANPTQLWFIVESATHLRTRTYHRKPDNLVGVDFAPAKYGERMRLRLIISTICQRELNAVVTEMVAAH